MDSKTEEGTEPGGTSKASIESIVSSGGDEHQIASNEDNIKEESVETEKHGKNVEVKEDTAEEHLADAQTDVEQIVSTEGSNIFVVAIEEVKDDAGATVVNQKPLVSYEDDDEDEEEEHKELQIAEEDIESHHILVSSSNKESANVSQILNDWEAASQDENPSQNGSAEKETEKPKDFRFSLKSYNVSKEEVLQELSQRPAETPLSLGKDLFVSIELAKRRKKEGQSNGADSSADREEIIGILEADQVKDWREAIVTDSNPSETTSNDMQGVISELADQSLKSTEASQKRQNSSQTPRATRGRGRPARKSDPETKEKERILALKQLQAEYMSSRRGKRSRIGNPTQVAAKDLQRALTSTSISGGKKRRPCYLPEDKQDENVVEEDLTPPMPVKTYSVPKRKSEDLTVEVQTALDTLAAANKHLSKSRKEEKEDKDVKTKVEKKKTVVKKKEVDKLLGDEGAIRMIYEATQGDASDRKNTRKEFMKKVQIVQSEVLKASTPSSQPQEKTLRRKRVTPSEESTPPSPPSENAVDGEEQGGSDGEGATAATSSARSGKRKKVAEASRILYRHSSSESFDSEGGLRLSTSELDDIDGNSRNSNVNTPVRKSSRPRKVSQKYANSVWMADVANVKKQLKLDGPNDQLESPPMGGSEEKKTGNPEAKKVAKGEEPMEKESPEEKKKAEEKEVKLRGPQIEIVEEKGVVTITLTPTTSKIENGFTLEVLEDFTEALKKLAFDKTCKIVVLRNRGQSFCQGMDLSSLEDLSSKQRPKAVKTLISALKNMVSAWLSFPKPIVAAVHGAAVGLGTALLPLCDVVLASVDATFSAPYAKLGQGLEAGASYTLRKLSRSLVSQLILKAEILTVKEAVRWGLVTEPVPLGTFECELEEVMTRLTTFSTQAVMTLKAQVAGRAEKLERALDLECDILQRDWNSLDCITAFTDRVRAGVLIPNQ